MEAYRYECESVEGFVQRAVVLAQRGYRYFVQGEAPERKPPAAVDERLLTKYDLRKTRRQRAYRKACGRPNGHYFRHGRTWVLMSTSREFFLVVDAKERVLDIRETPIRAHGYSVSLRRDGSARRRGEHRYRASVRLDLDTYRELRAYFEELALHRTQERLAAELWQESSRWQAYAPVHRQFRAILRRVNERRQQAGFESVPQGCVRRHRSHPKHFSSLPEMEKSARSAIGSAGQGDPSATLEEERDRLPVDLGESLELDDIDAPLAGLTLRHKRLGLP